MPSVSISTMTQYHKIITNHFLIRCIHLTASNIIERLIIILKMATERFQTDQPFFKDTTRPLK